MTIYYLPPHMHACVSNGIVIILDARRDKYFSLSYSTSKYLAMLPQQRSLHEHDINIPEKEEFNSISMINELLRAGIITENPNHETHFPTRNYIKPKSDCSNAHFTPFYPITAGHFIKFIKAFTWAIISTKIFGTYHTLLKAAQFKNQLKRTQNFHNNSDLQTIMQIYRQIRIFFYTAKNHCYFDCAVLMHFLKECGYDATWVFGVKADPFEAHCWVQVGDVVMTGWQLDTYGFTPILAI